MTLRVLHTSDWHLGRTLHEARLLEDQRWALTRLVELARQAKPDVIVVAGDLYDRAVPPAEAVELLDAVLTELAALGAPLVLTAGNHDSGERIAFGARLLAASGVHLRGLLEHADTPIEIPGKGVVFAMPFLDPELVRAELCEPELHGHAEATARVVSRLRDRAGDCGSLPKVLVGHAFVQGAAATPDSERPLVVGNAGCVPAEAFAGFDYVALGHLHAPQEVTAGMRYSGSLLKYSFAEAGHVKGVVVAEVECGRVRAELVPLGAKRDVARVEGSLAELLSRPDLEPRREDLLEATLTDPGYVLDAKRRLQERFPFVVSVVRKELASGTLQGDFGAQVAGAGADDLELFRAFFERVSGSAPDDGRLAVFSQAAEAVDREAREA